MDYDRLVTKLRQAYRGFREPLVTAISRKEHNPFKVLIATLLSLRTRDEQTETAAASLFALAATPAGIAALPPETIARTIYPVGFYRNKATTIVRVCEQLLALHQGQVPATMEELLALPGVGRKSANLVLTRGFGLPGICVDTHVHRICNRLGLVATATPEETEMELRRILPPRYWIEWNDLLVAYGQNLCSPLSPRCSACVVSDQCRRVGIARSR